MTLFGTPVFSMGSDKYESDTMAFNFKTKKGLISNVYTQQEDGFCAARYQSAVRTATSSFSMVAIPLAMPSTPTSI